MCAAKKPVLTMGVTGLHNSYPRVLASLEFGSNEVTGSFGGVAKELAYNFKSYNTLTVSYIRVKLWLFKES